MADAEITLRHDRCDVCGRGIVAIIMAAETTKAHCPCGAVWRLSVGEPDEPSTD